MHFTASGITPFLGEGQERNLGLERLGQIDPPFFLPNCATGILQDTASGGSYCPRLAANIKCLLSKVFRRELSPRSLPISSCAGG